MPAAITSLSTNPEFADICAAWSYAQWESQLPGMRLSDVMAQYARIAGADGSGLPLVWVAYDDQSGRPMGMITLKAEEPESSDEWSPWVGHLFVHPTWRGQGIADMLMKSLEVEAKRKGYDALYLTTSTAEDYYRRKQAGWMEIERVKSPYMVGRYVPIMKKSL